MERIAILFVYDEPLQGSHLLIEAKETQDLRDAGERSMRRLATQLATG